VAQIISSTSDNFGTTEDIVVKKKEV